jgi:hypothetical protein
MADKENNKSKRLTREALLQLRADRKAKVRYGRATLTVERTDGVLMTSLTELLGAHRKGEASAEDVAWAFIKERVVEHSPTLQWEDIDLLKLLPRVTGVTREPEIKARTPGGLVPELEAIEAKEREQWERARKQMKQMLSGGISQDLLKSINLTNEIARAMRPAYLDAFKAFRPAHMDAFKAIRPTDMDAMKAIQPGLNEQVRATIQPLSAQIRQAMQPQLKALNFRIDPKVYEGFIGLSRVDLSKQLGLSNQILASNEAWRSLFEQVAEAARGADSPDIAEAVESTVEAAAKKPTELDLEGLTATLNSLLKEQERTTKEQERLADEQQEANQKLAEMQSSSAIPRQMIIGIAISIVWTLILLILATQFGIFLPPPPPTTGK